MMDKEKIGKNVHEDLAREVRLVSGAPANVRPAWSGETTGDEDPDCPARVWARPVTAVAGRSPFLPGEAGTGTPGDPRNGIAGPGRSARIVDCSYRRGGHAL